MEDNDCFYKACYVGIIPEVLIFIQKRRSKVILNECLYWACRGNQPKVINIIEKNSGHINWINALDGACIGGHLELVKYIIEKAEKKVIRLKKNKKAKKRKNKFITIINKITYKTAFRNAIKGGSIEIIKLLEEKCIENIFDNSYKRDSLDIYETPIDFIEIIKYIENYPLINWDYEFSYICKRGSIESIEYVLSKCTDDDWNSKLEYACMTSSLEIVNLVISRAPKDYRFNWNDIFYYASRSLNIEIIKFIFSKGPTNWRIVFEHACHRGNLAAVELIISEYSNFHWEYSNFHWDRGLFCAFQGNHYNVAKLMFSKGAKINGLCLHASSNKMIDLLVHNGIKIKDKNVMKKYKEYIKSKIITSVFLKKNRIPFQIVNMIINEYF